MSMEKAQKWASLPECELEMKFPPTEIPGLGYEMYKVISNIFIPDTNEDINDY
jgi:hypothetical protein